jgi:phosphoribosylanthranilate isomerase
VFVNQPIQYVEEVASLVRLGAVQLHGDEPIEYAERLRDRVIRAVALSGPGGEQAALDLPARVTVLLDVHDPARRGGTGRTVDWDAAARVARRRTTILSGGLRPDNVVEAIARVKPHAIDVSSGVERRPGEKDAGRLRALFAAINQQMPEPGEIRIF